MRTTLAQLLVPVALLATACSEGTSRSASMSDDLKQDLQASAAAKPELATPGGDFKPMRFVSELEQTNQSTPVERVQTPRRVAARKAGPAPAETNSPAPEPKQEIQVAQATTEESEAPAPEAAPEVSAVPSVAPRPAPMPVDVPSTTEGYGQGGMGSGRGGSGPGVGIGDVIGVVIRGGGVGVDHCPPPRRRGRGGMGFPRYGTVIVRPPVRVSR